MSSFVIATSTASLDDASKGGGDGNQDPLRQWSSLIGIITAIVGNVLIALALNVQRYAHTKLNKEIALSRQRARATLQHDARRSNNASPYGTASHSQNRNGNAISSVSRSADESQSYEGGPLPTSPQFDATDIPREAADTRKVSHNYLKSPYWWLGQILITLGEMGNFLAYGFAPASIVSPLGVVALVSNCIIAPVMFHEKFRQRDFWGVVIAVSGVVTVVLSAKQEETRLNPGDILDAITTLEFEIYLGITVILIALLMWASGRYGRRTSLIDLGLVGLFGGYTALATKGVSSMLSSTLWRAFTSPLTYLLVFILLGTAIMQIRYVNKALQRFDSTQVIPIQFVMFTLCVIIGSAVLYRDFEKTTTERAVKFVGGCLLTFFGVFLITSGRQKKVGDEDLIEDAHGIDESIGLIDQDGNPASVSAASCEDDVSCRRSSKVSRVSFAKSSRAFDQDEPEENATLRMSTSGTPTQRHLEASEQDAELLGYATRTLSFNSVASAPAPSISDTALNVPTVLREAQATPQLGAERPVTPRANTTTSKSNRDRDRDGTFYSPSPLYSTVKTVVKDALRDSALMKSQSSLRRIRSSIRASLFLDSDEEHTDNEREAQRALIDLAECDGESESTGEPGHERTRSFGETVGNFFRSKRRTQKKNLDSEAGGSNPESSV